MSENRIEETKDTQSPVLATIWMMGALVSFTIMALSGRELSSDLSTFQILLFRSLCGLLIMSIILSKTGWHVIRTPMPGWHLFRNTIHFGGQYGWFLGISLLPLAEVIAIEFTTPVWSALLAMAVLGERLTQSRGMSLVLGFAGILLILRPGFQALSVPALIVLVAALFYASTYITTKIMGRTEPTLAILFYMCLIQLPMAMIPALLMDWSPLAWSMLPWILGVGASALCAHYCLTKALSLADATVVVPMDFMRLPLISIIGFTFYGETVDIWLLAGAGLIALGTLVSLKGERKPRVESPA